MWGWIIRECLHECVEIGLLPTVRMIVLAVENVLFAYCWVLDWFPLNIDIFRLNKCVQFPLVATSFP